MTWLRDNNRKQFQDFEESNSNGGPSSSVPKWVREQYIKSKQQEIIEKFEKLQQDLKDALEIEEAERRSAQNINGKSSKRRHIAISTEQENMSNDDQFVLDDVASALECLDEKEQNVRAMSAKTRALLDELDQGSSLNADEQKNADNGDSIFATQGSQNRPLKIYFASRTHSQLSQFVGQLKLPHFPSVIPQDLLSHSKTISSDRSLIELFESIRHISLSSRKQLCIHPKISKYHSAQQINDACLELQKSKSKTKSKSTSISKKLKITIDDKENECGCPYMLNPNDLRDRVKNREFRNASLIKIRDIEDLAELGRQKKVCPYYATRNVANNNWAEVISLPYQLLLQKESRESLGLDLKNSIVIIDEAHNLLDTISSIHSLSITYSQISQSLKALEFYKTKFESRLTGRNLISLSKLIQVVKYLYQFFKAAKNKPFKETAPGSNIKITDFFPSDSTVDMINVHDLEKFVHQTHLVFKIEGYMEKILAEQKSVAAKDSNRAESAREKLVLSKVISFILAIGSPSWEGQFFFGRNEQNELQVEYILLDPSSKFKPIVEESRCIILAGGTMKPTDDFTNYLFPYLDPEQVSFFSCDHIIPDQNLTVLPISGNSGMNFNFTFAHRNNQAMIEKLGETILEICKCTPDGIVVFLPSYTYMASVFKIWKSSQINKVQTINDAIANTKEIFWEPHSGMTDQFSKNSTEMEEDSDQKSMKSMKRDYSTKEVLDNYSKYIFDRRKDPTSGGKTGAILFAVVGGKVSEGINFQDELARAVVMVGLPFPHAFSAEMVAKRKYIEQESLKRIQEQQGKGDKLPSSLEAQKKFAQSKAMEFYENICMKAVNQCVGRAIRHANDYAAIVLIDERYTKLNIQKKLSDWIRKGITSYPNNNATFSNAKTKLNNFFQSK